MIEFAWPWMFGLLPLPALVWVILPPASGAEGAVVRMPAFDPVARIAGDAARRAAGPRRVLAAALLVWALLVLAAARPQWLGEPLPTAQAGRDLMLAVDLSASMKRADFEEEGEPLNRLEIVKRVARSFIEARSGDRVGLILFGSRAYLQAPLTFDRITVRQLLDEAEIGLAGDATAIGDAIALGVKHLDAVPSGERVLVLLTDGRSTAGAIEPETAGELARDHGVRIYTVGLGAERMLVDGFLGRRIVDPSRDLDEELLERIAQMTSGRYFRARDAGALREVYAEIDRLEPRAGDDAVFRPVDELYVWPLGVALALAGAQQAWLVRRRRHVLRAPNAAQPT
ncbi:MAG: VWA domain-containing protein [Chromatiales bacterium]|nr:VWA domain-containing protein [Chromatiales bacterium]